MLELYMVIVEMQDEQLVVFDYNVEYSTAVQSSENARELLKPHKIWVVPQARKYNLT